MLYNLTAPLIVKGKVNFSLNLNQYRNAHYFKLNDSKIAFKAYMKDQIELLPAMDKIAITYTLYPKTHKLVDISNVCSIVDKYFSDALVELGKIPDDNYKHVLGIMYRFGSVDKLNPRVEILVSDVSNVEL